MPTTSSTPPPSPPASPPPRCPTCTRRSCPASARSRGRCTAAPTSRYAHGREDQGPGQGRVVDPQGPRRQDAHHGLRPPRLPRGRPAGQAPSPPRARAGQAGGEHEQGSRSLDTIRARGRPTRSTSFPNVDLFSGAAYASMGIPTDQFTPIFAMSRVAGWAAHVLEQHGNNRLIRPRGEYTGALDLKYVPAGQPVGRGPGPRPATERPPCS